MTQVSILREDNTAVVTVTVPGDPKSPYIARDDHPNFKAMVAAAATGSLDDLPSLFDVAETIATKFQRLSDRVTVNDGQVHFDGVAVDSTLSQQILDVIQEGATEASYKGLVAFMENIYTNPDGPTATRIFDWLKAQDGVTITDEGNIVGYKYAKEDDEYGYRSVAGGNEPVTVRFADGTEQVFTGRIPNPVGATIEMPRNLVDNDANRTCSVGLHVGAWNYVKRNSTILEIHVNPRDVVSVPTDYNGEKVRVCRYKVIGPITEKYGQAIKTAEDEAPRERGTSDVLDLDVMLAPLAKPEPPELQVGDKLRLIDNQGMGETTYVGMVATVTDPRPGELLVNVAWDASETTQIDGGYYKTRFEKVESVTAFKVGDRLTGRYLASEAVVERVRTCDDPLYFLRFTDGSAGWFDSDTIGEVKVVSANEGAGVNASEGRAHGKGGPTSQAAKGRGLHPAQDPQTGKFVAGRPGSRRDPNTGRFA